MKYVLVMLAPLALAAALGACGTDRVPRSDAGYFTGPDAADGPEGPPAAGVCEPARTAETLAARVQVTSEAAAVASSTTIFVADMFRQFRSHCGSCHVDVGLGNFRVSEQTFGQEAQKAIDAMRGEDPAKVMPPATLGGKPFSQRIAGDPIVELAALLERWIAASKPNPLIIPATERGEGEGANRYLVSPDIGAQLTNLGNCIPSRTLVATARSRMDELDAFFAQATALPDRLDQTDMVALDSETLARHGVISFAPTYPLWSDNAGKMRHVRVPRGTSITFDRATQQFAIPANSRFYKTFLKKVIDRDGNESYRKIETRLIVARPDAALADDTAEVRALYGSYIWNEDETEAVLLRDPLRNGKPFTDQVLTYIVDEPRAKEIRETTTTSVAYALEQAPGVLRRYAIPGSTRCVECHMGSPSASFILGFTPLQIHRRPMGAHGIIEPAGEDELTQLQRLIDYKVVTGISSPSEVLPLEESQGTRKPRTEEELIAQGYMVGNCAGCHNPRGFPTVKNKELRDLLDFLPAPDGGIFEFPLERYSPRIKRGETLDDPIPYITPSLRDLPRSPDAYQFSERRTPKWEWDVYAQDKPVDFVDAPWRSLIYRNVDAPFTYSDDLAIYPRMPRNTPSFDCRAPRIMAEWMVGLPARRKRPMTSEHTLPPPTPKPLTWGDDTSDTSPQPWVEVKPGDTDYETAKAQAAGRLQAYRNGRRFSYCPNTEDILDSRVKGLVLVPPDEKIVDPSTKKIVLGLDSVPDRPHWVPTDLTEPDIEWLPRRPDWNKVLAPDKPADRQLTPAQRKDNTYLSVLEALDRVRITQPLRKLVLTPVPFGLWKSKPECTKKLAHEPRVGDLAGADRPAWMDRVTPRPPADERVYRSSAGAAIFNAICVNCHGPKADSRGLQAETLGEMTGGDARVANLRDGLLGLVDKVRNIDRVFGPFAGAYPRGVPGAPMVTAQDWAGRYVAWMALGGTEKRIPQAILNNVGASKIMGLTRQMRESGVSTPNMLQAAEQLCRNAIPHASVGNPIKLASFFTKGAFDWSAETALVDTTGDADMWIKLCSFQNRPLVRVVRDQQNWDGTTQLQRDLVLQGNLYYWADGLPLGAQVMDQTGAIVSWDEVAKARSHFTICAERPKGATELARATKFFADNPVAGKAVMPFCPPELDAVGDDGAPKWKLKVEDDGNGRLSYVDIQRWAARGAINAGLAVFLYLDEIKKGTAPTPRYDQCQELPEPPARTQ